MLRVGLRGGVKSFTWRGLCSSNVFGDDNATSRILMSPSLVSLDVPEHHWILDSDSNPHQPHLSRFTSSNHLSPSAALIDGKAIAEEIRSQIANQVSRMKSSIGKVPGLAVISVGHRKDSQTYVRNKVIACQQAGIRSQVTQLPDYCSEDQIISALTNFNDNPDIHGILVQLPLPEHFDEAKILGMVQLEKDIDGFHPLNMGNIAMRGREPLYIPCTPKGCIELLLRSGVEITGKRAVVIGQSNIVGLPMSLLLERYHATVTVVNAFTKNPEMITREADIVVAAVGIPNLVRGSWLKHGAVVIDVGTFPKEFQLVNISSSCFVKIEIYKLFQDSTAEHGYHLIGDVCYAEAVKVASAITPVPGGVGPMTIAMLLLNTLESANRAHNFR